MAIDMERIRAYNAELKRCKDKSNKLTTELEISQRELSRICEELTNMLGMQVTPENIQQVYTQLTAKIENTLQTGEEILARIRAEEAASNPENQAQVYAEQIPGVTQQVTIEEPAPPVQPAQMGFAPPVQSFGTVPGFGGMPPMFAKQQ